MTDLSSWTAYFQDFGQFFNGFLFTLALAIGSFILAMVFRNLLWCHVNQ